MKKQIYSETQGPYRGQVESHGLFSLPKFVEYLDMNGAEFVHQQIDQRSYPFCSAFHIYHVESEGVTVYHDLRTSPKEEASISVTLFGTKEGIESLEGRILEAAGEFKLGEPVGISS